MKKRNVIFKILFMIALFLVTLTACDDNGLYNFKNISQSQTFRIYADEDDTFETFDLLPGKSVSIAANGESLSFYYDHDGFHCTVEVTQKTVLFNDDGFYDPE